MWICEVLVMRAVVVYESMYGNTHLIADAIATGLRPRFEARVVPVSGAGARRPPTACGLHLAAAVAERGTTVVSGGA